MGWLRRKSTGIQVNRDALARGRVWAACEDGALPPLVPWSAALDALTATRPFACYITRGSLVGP